MNLFLSSAVVSALIAADPTPHLPIHKPSRIFRPDDIREALVETDGMGAIKDIIRKLEGDPQKLERLASMTELAQKLGPERFADLAKISPAFRSIAEKLKDSEFQQRLFEDPALRRAAERMASKPEIRDLVERLAGSFADKPRLQPQRRPATGAEPELPGRSADNPSTPTQRAQQAGRNNLDSKSDAAKTPSSTPPVEVTRPLPPGSTPAGSTDGSGGPPSSPIKDWLPELDLKKSRYVQQAINRISPEKLINQTFSRTNGSESSELRIAPLLKQAESAFKGIAENTKGLRNWSRETTQAVRSRMPSLPKMSVPKVSMPNISVPIPKVPRVSLPSFSPPSVGGGSRFGIGVFAAVVIVAVVLIAALMRWETSSGLRRVWKRKRRPRPIRGDDDRAKICNLYEATALSTLGDSIRTHHHLHIARLLWESHRQRRAEVEAFSQLYESARYGSEDEPLAPDALQRAVQYSANLGELAPRPLTGGAQP